MIITVDPDRSFHDRVSEAVKGAPWAHTAFHVVDPEQAPPVVEAHGVPSVVIVGPRVAVPAATTLTQRLVNSPAPVFVLLVTEPTNDVLRAAMRAGARDVLPPNFADEDLRSAIDRTGLSVIEGSVRTGLTVAVFSAKGGVGTSTLAANLATRFADRINERAVLIDLDVASADQAIMHGLMPEWTLQQLTDGTISTDPESLTGVLLSMEGSKAALLPGPLDPALAETITGDAVTRVIAAARQVSPVLVLDTASAFDDRTLAAFDAADVIVAVSSLDVAALRALTVSLQTMSRIGVDPDDVRVALVRADSKSGLQVVDVERTIARDVDVRIPSSRAVVRSLNEGIPLAVSQQRSGYVQAIDELVDAILPAAPESLRRAAETTTSTGGWFGFGRGRSDDGGGPTRAAGEAATGSAHVGPARTSSAAAGEASSAGEEEDPPRGADTPSATDSRRQTEVDPEATGTSEQAASRSAIALDQDDDVPVVLDATSSNGTPQGDAAATTDDDHDEDLALDSLPPPSSSHDEDAGRRGRFGRRR